MKILKSVYERIYNKPAPAYYSYSPFTLAMKPIRKWLTNSLVPSCPFNCVRIFIYRLCGFKIGKHVFIGMHCYLDDMCYDLLSIGNNVTISYGVYFACHGRKQKHEPISIEDGAYLGMCARVISSVAGGIIIGKNSVVGACALVNRDVPDGATAVGVPCRILDKK